MRFYLIDRIHAYEADVQLTAVKCVTMESPYLEQHFPGEPVLPGVLTLEAMAQASGYLVWRSIKDLEGRVSVPILHTVVRSRFIRVVRPGDRLRVVARLLSRTPHLAVTRVEVDADGEPAARAELQFVLTSGRADDPMEALWRQLTVVPEAAIGGGEL